MDKDKEQLMMEMMYEVTKKNAKYCDKKCESIMKKFKPIIEEATDAPDMDEFCLISVVYCKWKDIYVSAWTGAVVYWRIWEYHALKSSRILTNLANNLVANPYNDSDGE